MGSQKDEIAEGLHQRLLGDVVGGMIATWQMQRIEQMYAKREVEYAAKLSDYAALGEAIATARDDTLPQFDVELLGIDPKQTLWAPGSLPMSCRLRYDRPLPKSIGGVKVEVEPQPFFVVTEARPDAVVRVVKQPVIFRMVANDGAGPVVGEKRIEFTVSVMPSADQVIRNAFALSARVHGKGTRVSVGGSSPGTDRTNIGIEVDWRPEGGPSKISWSGNAFTLDAKKSTGAGSYDDPKTVLTVKAKGKFDPGLNTISFVADQEESTEGKTEDRWTSKRDTRHIEASDIPIDQVWAQSIVPGTEGSNWNPYVSAYTRTPDARAVRVHRIAGRLHRVETCGSESGPGASYEVTETIEGPTGDGTYPASASVNFTAPRTAFPAGAK
jgi:hypothetical protein